MKSGPETWCSCALVSCRQSTSASCARNQSKNPLPAAERTPLALKLTMRKSWPVLESWPKRSGFAAPGGLKMPAMTDHRTRFLTLALRAQALRFGEFTLKSGRSSPYFFNAGRFDSGAALAELADCYADAIDAALAPDRFDLLFCPAYKGIPLASALACSYARRGRDLPLAFNRKEAKAHGEGGSLIGAPAEGRRVLIVDDVITAGTAIREALAIIRDGGGTPAAIVIALDRQEVIDPDARVRRSAAQDVAAEHGIPVIAVASVSDLLAFAGESAELVAEHARLLAYRQAYGCQPG